MPRPELRQILFALAFFAAATVLFSWPISAHVADGLGDVWDAKLNAWIFHWDYHQTFRDPGHLFDANIFYPARWALAFSENLYGAAVFGFPLFAFGASTLTVYNVLFLLGMFLSAVSAWLLAREVTGDWRSSLIAGIVYAYVPWRIAQIPHVQFQWGPFLPLLLLFLRRYLDTGRRRDAALLAIFFAWNALANVHYAIFSGFLVAVVLSYRLLHDGRALWRRTAVAVGALAVASAVLVPFFLPYVRASRAYGMTRGEDEIRSFSGRPIDLLTAGPQNKLYAPLTQKLAQPEGDFFPGLAVAALAVAAFPLGRKRERDRSGRASGKPRLPAGVLDLLAGLLVLLWIAAKVRPGLTLAGIHLRDPGRILVFATVILAIRLLLAFPERSGYRNLSDFVRCGPIPADLALFAAIAATGLLVAFGMHTPYYRILVESFGSVFRSIRVPSRGIVLFDLGIGVLAAMGLREWRARVSARAGSAALTAALLVTALEYRAFPVEVSPVDPAPAPAQRWLASLAPGTPVVEWPIGPDPDVDHEFRSPAHWQPLLNGYSGFAPRPYDSLVSAANAQPQSPDVWRQMGELGARVLIFHAHLLAGDARLAYVRGALAGLAAGEAAPLRIFEHGRDRDVVLAIGGGLAGVAPDPDAATAARSLLEQVASPPFGYIDRPLEGATVAPGDWLFGWALDDSGVAAVGVSIDGGAEMPARYGQPHPGVPPVHPDYPDSRRAGFGFALPPLPPGDHVVKIVIRAKDGGVTELERRIQTR